MQALQLTAWKPPPEVREVADPEPAAGQVVVEVAAAGACHSDLHLIHDFEPGLLPWDPPFTLGHENAGWVEAVGPGVERPRGGRAGRRLRRRGAAAAAAAAAQGMENYCERQRRDRRRRAAGSASTAAWRAYMLVPHARLLVPLGDLDPVEAAPLTDAGLTPYHAIKRSLPLLVPGSTAVVIGVGGLGHLAVQILRAIARPGHRRRPPARGTRAGDAVGRRPRVLARRRRGGRDPRAHRGRAPTSSSTSSASTRRWRSRAVARPLGHVTVVGIGGGSLPFSFFTVPYEVSLATTYWGSLPELIEVLDLARRGLVRAHVERFSLDQVPAAYEKLAAGEVDGRVVIVP